MSRGPDEDLGGHVAMGDRFSRGLRLAKASWSVVRGDPALIWLPICSMVCSLVVIAAFGLGIAGVGLPQDGQSPSFGVYLLAFLMYVTLSFVTIYFNAAVIAIAMKRMDGEDATLRDGLALARQHAGAILVWAVLTTTVGMILRGIQERSGLLGRILLGIIGVVWSVITFFVVPVLLFEGLGAVPAIKRSASIVRERWGEQITGNLTIGLVFLLILIPVGIVGGLVAAAIPVVGLPLLVVAVVVVIAVGTAVSGVFNAALYRFATTGQAGGAFSDADLYASFRPRKGSAGLPEWNPSTQGSTAPPPPAPAEPGSDVPPTRPDAWS